MRGFNDSTGVALVEVYDLNPNAASELANISTRGFVQTGDNVMIAGIIVGGGNPMDVIVRATGPSLTQRGVSGILNDPTLELYNAQGSVIGSNDNWKQAQHAQIQSSALAPSFDAESAIIHTLFPGNYTAIVRGKDASTGVALVEVYVLR